MKKKKRAAILKFELSATVITDCQRKTILIHTMTGHNVMYLGESAWLNKPFIFTAYKYIKWVCKYFIFIKLLQ